jgi:Asp-tRNA(Asn)/Glu-tRNA(Gln) amidotransferase A subunit family amidase
VGCFPSISVPIGLTGEGEDGTTLGGLPVELELVSPLFREQEFLNLARGVEIFVGGRKEPVV